MSTPLLILLFALELASAPGADAAAADEVLAPGASLEKLWGEGSFTEGGALAGDGAILFSDIGDRIMRYDPSTGSVGVFRDPSGRANGLIFDPEGRLIAAEGANTGGGRRGSITERDGTVRALAERSPGRTARRGRPRSATGGAVPTPQTPPPSIAAGGFMPPPRVTSAPSPASSIS